MLHFQIQGQLGLNKTCPEEPNQTSPTAFEHRYRVAHRYTGLRLRPMQILLREIMALKLVTNGLAVERRCELGLFVMCLVKVALLFCCFRYRTAHTSSGCDICGAGLGCELVITAKMQKLENIVADKLTEKGALSIFRWWKLS